MEKNNYIIQQFRNSSGPDLALNLTVAYNWGGPGACPSGKFLKFEARKCNFLRPEHRILSKNLALTRPYFKHKVKKTTHKSS